LAGHTLNVFWFDVIFEASLFPPDGEADFL
jgi:hypothetical protein